MTDKELDDYMKTVNPNFNSHIEKGTIEMNNEYYNLLEEKMARLINKNQKLKKQLEERKYYKFYKYENNPNGSDYCFCERPCDSNMSLICFFENGELCGFMSETLVSNHDDIKEISLNEFAHKFIKPSINANFQNKKQQKEFIKYLEDEIKQNTPYARWKHYNEDGINVYEVENPTCIEVQPTNKVLKEVLQKYKEIIGVLNE
jgi:hypothetical protein